MLLSLGRHVTPYPGPLTRGSEGFRAGPLPWSGPSARRIVAAGECAASPLQQTVADLFYPQAHAVRSAPTALPKESPDSSHRETRACACAW